MAKEKIHVSKVVDVTVDYDEWMAKYGPHITSNQLVPAVTLEGAIMKAVRTGLEKTGMKSLEVK